MKKKKELPQYEIKIVEENTGVTKIIFTDTPLCGVKGVWFTKNKDDENRKTKT